jgi:hypothetical protein
MIRDGRTKMRRSLGVVCALLAACSGLHATSARTAGGPTAVDARAGVTAARHGRNAEVKEMSDEPYPDEEWAVWYVDTFDRDAAPRIEVRGRGLVEGLAQLWARHMFETVRPDGQDGFSRFDLRWKQGRAEVGGDREGARRLRGWLFGKKESSYKGYAAEADPALLKKVATTHARLIERRQKAEQILATALAATDRADFMKRLDDLMKK